MIFLYHNISFGVLYIFWPVMGWQHLVLVGCPIGVERVPEASDLNRWQIVGLDPYSTSLGCRRQPSLACHAWNHGKSPKSSPLSQQCRFHCHTWSAGESHYCVNSKGFMKFGTHTNEESDEYQQKWLPLSDLVGLCSKYIAIPYGSMAFILKNLPFPTVSRVKGL